MANCSLTTYLASNAAESTKNLRKIDAKDLFNNQDEKIVMLENLRFNQEEEENILSYLIMKKNI